MKDCGATGCQIFSEFLFLCKTKLSHDLSCSCTKRKQVGKMLSESSSEDDLDNPEVVRGRKRARNVVGWRRNILKRLRTSGNAYETSRGKHVETKCKPNSGAICPCKRLCSNRIDNEQRKTVIESFYGLPSKDLQDGYLCGLIGVHKVKNRRPRKEEDSRTRCGSFTYKVGFILLSIYPGA